MTSTDDSSEIELQEVRFGEGGLLYRFARAVGLLPGWGGVVRVGVAIALLTWLPLVVLSAIERTLLSGPTIPLRQSFGTHARLILAIPVFFWAESLFTGRITEVLHTMLQSQLVRPEDLPRFGRACRQARRWWESQAVEAVFIVLAAVAIYAGLRTDISAGVATWRTTADGRLSVAGWWYTAVSLPFFQFLLWRWAWRLLVWGQLLWKISRLNLDLVPTHPDRAGGLGSLGVAHVDLAPLGFAASAVLAASFAEEIMFGGRAVVQAAVPAVGTILGSTLAWIAPLFLFSRRLLEVRQRGLLEYGALATSVCPRLRHEVASRRRSARRALPRKRRPAVTRRPRQQLWCDQ